MRIRVARKGAGPPQSKCHQLQKCHKKALLLQFLFMVFWRTSVINNNIDNHGPAPLNSNFANLFKCVTRVKLRAIVLKIAISGPHLTFL